ncbi:MAG: hypothetical protein QXI77_03225, partial [Nanopusillaceae archaeon]
MKKDIIILNENSNIAISTLWSKKEIILNQLQEKIRSKIGIIGTTYTTYGINFILETLAQFPKIDTLIIYGADLSLSGKALIDVFKNKNFRDYKIVFPINKIENVLNTVKIIDLREEFKKNNIKKLEEEIEKNFKTNAKEVREKIDITIEEKVELASWPIPLSGSYIYDTSIFRAWIKTLDLIMKFGSVKFSEYEEPQKEFLNLMITIGLYGKEYKIEEEFFEFLKREDFERHINEVL